MQRRSWESCGSTCRRPHHRSLGSPIFALFVLLMVTFFFPQVPGRSALAQRLLQSRCTQQGFRASRSPHAARSVPPPLRRPGRAHLNFVGCLELEQPWPPFALFKFVFVVGFVSVPIRLFRLLSMGRLPAQTLDGARQQNAFLPPAGAGPHQRALCSDRFCSIATCHVQQLQYYARSRHVRGLLCRVRLFRLSSTIPHRAPP
jgi:hypothetical protein